MLFNQNDLSIPLSRKPVAHHIGYIAFILYIKSTGHTRPLIALVIMELHKVTTVLLLQRDLAAGLIDPSRTFPADALMIPFLKSNQSVSPADQIKMQSFNMRKLSYKDR